jgi:hypothetical protein
MPTVLQHRRGNVATMSAFTGANGEIVVNTDTEVIHVHDGVTAGGYALQRSQKSIIVDFGTNDVYTISGTISDSKAIVNSTYRSIVSMFASAANTDGTTSTIFYGDELEFDNFNCAAYVSTNGTINYYIEGTPGPIANTRIFNYILS